MRLHSPTSRFGTLSGAHNLPFGNQLRPFMNQVLEQIRDGRFARHWEKEQQAGYPNFRKLLAQAESHPINQVEERMRKLLKFKTE
jgi:ketol-acid reductoisomerase